MLSTIVTVCAFAPAGRVDRSSSAVSMAAERSKAVPFLMKPAKVVKVFLSSGFALSTSFSRQDSLELLRCNHLPLPTYNSLMGL